jgi:hypothetical protein
MARRRIGIDPWGVGFLVLVALSTTVMVAICGLTVMAVWQLATGP